MLVINNDIYSQSKAEYFSYSGYWNENNAQENYPDIEVEWALHRIFVGYFYVEGIIKEAKITGYYYNDEYYSGNDLIDYGIVFPIRAETPLATIKFHASLNHSSFYDVEFNVQMNLDRVAKSTKEIKFDKIARENWKKYIKDNNIKGGGTYLWEKYGDFSVVTLVSFSSTSYSKIERAIKSKLKNEAVEDEEQTQVEEEERESGLTISENDDSEDSGIRDNKRKKEKKKKKNEEYRKSNYSIASEYYYKAQNAYNAGNYNLALRHIENALSIFPNNYKFKALAQKIREKSIAKNFASGMTGLAEAGITSGIMYNSTSSFGLVFGYHSGSSSYRPNKPDNWSVLFSYGFMNSLTSSIEETGGAVSTYSLMVGLPFDIYNPLHDIPLPLISARYLTFSVGASQSDGDETGWNFGLQDIGDDIGSYLIYDTAFGFEFGIMAAF